MPVLNICSQSPSRVCSQLINYLGYECKPGVTDGFNVGEAIAFVTGLSPLPRYDGERHA